VKSIAGNDPMGAFYTKRFVGLDWKGVAFETRP
jgi:hypothetical protein